MSDVKTTENNVKAKSKKSVTSEAGQSKKTPATRSLKELRLELQKLILDVRSGKEKNTSLIRKAKKEIARLLTNLRINNGK